MRKQFAAWPDGMDSRHPVGMPAEECIKVIKSFNSQHSSRGQLSSALLAASQMLKDSADQQRICAAAQQHLRSLTPAVSDQADSE